jgi:hypothetical protein
MIKYYYLKKGDVVLIGDEVEITNQYSPQQTWQKTICAGTIAPDPRFMTNKKYRRSV